MAREAFDRELEYLFKNIGVLGNQVEKIMEDTIRALKTRDLNLAKEIYENDPLINAAQNNIEQFCVNLIALQQPIARDLRGITATLKMLTDIERTADQCADICEIMSTYPEFIQAETPTAILEMFEISKEMFGASIDAFIRRDTELAVQVIGRDDEVDNLFSRTILELSNQMQTNQNAVSQATDYMFVAKYIERMGDHAVNIAEWTIYAVTGEHKNMTDKILGNRKPLQ